MAMQITVIKVGRPRKTGVPRNDKGRIASGFDRERPEEIRRVVEMQPHRRNRKDFTYQGKKITKSDPLYGYSLGRLRVAGMGDKGDGITQEQHDAGMKWMQLHVRYCHYQGFASPNLQSPAMQMVARGLTCAPDPDEDVILKVRRQWADAYEAINRYGNHFELLKRVIIEDRDPTNMLELGALRIALNALVHLWRAA